jgi:N-acetylmuramate 1-kinase
LPLAGDASFRRYFRVVDGARRAVLMDAPPPHEDPRPFVAVGEWLGGHGFAAPEILARDLDQGLLLL